MIGAWITVDDLAEAPADGALAQEIIDAVSFVLFHLSGRKYSGVHQVTEEYCQVGLDQLGISSYYGPQGRPPLPGPSGYSVMYPELQYGIITNRIGGMCSSCGCPHLLRLRGGPVLSVEAVYQGSREICMDDVVLYDYSFIATPPYGCWGSCDELEVSYTYGAPPPALGRLAAKALADQYLLALSGSDECALPQRVTSISRQGVNWTLLDPQDFLDKGRTGIYQVDLFISTVNPDGARLRSRVFSPDIPRGKSYRWASDTTT